MDQTMYKIGERLITKDMVILNNIYIDIKFLKYIELGKLLSHQNLTPDTYTGIANTVLDKSFKSRNTDDVEVVFKDVKDIETLLNTSTDKSEDIVFKISPTFDGPIGFIKKCIESSDASKQIIKLKKPTVVTIDISCLPTLSVELCTQLMREYSALFGTDIRLLRNGINDLQSKTLDFEGYFISDLAKFNVVMIDHLNAEKLSEKYLFCMQILPLSKLPKVTGNIIPLTFQNIELVMTAASKFQFIHPFACLT